MEEEEKIEEEEQEEGEARGKKSFFKWIIIAVAVAALGGGVFFAWTKFSPPPESNTAEHPKKEAKIGHMFPLDSFIVNLAEEKGRRYLKVRMELELDSEIVQEEVEKRLPQFRDSLLVLLSSKTFQQIEGVAGKNLLRDEIVSRLNGFLTSGKVKEVYFTEMVVQ